MALIYADFEAEIDRREESDPNLRNRNDIYRKKRVEIRGWVA